MNHPRAVPPREALRRRRVRRLAKKLLQHVSLSSMARKARINKSTLHRFLYEEKTIKEDTADRILNALILLDEHRRKERLPRRSSAAITRS